MPDRKANIILRNAIRLKKIIKPNKCDKCGLEFEKRKIAGHHNDYKKPLKVLWLCPACHTKVEEKRNKKIQFKIGFDKRRNKTKGLFKKGFDTRRNYKGINQF